MSIFVADPSRNPQHSNTMATKKTKTKTLSVNINVTTGKVTIRHGKIFIKTDMDGLTAYNNKLKRARARAKIAAAKKRWAMVKKAGKSSL